MQTNLVDLGFPDIGVFQLGGNLVLRLEQDASFRITDGSDITTLQASMQSWTDVPTSSATITEGASFTDDLDADSLALIELVEALEDELGERTVGFRIDDEDLEDLKTVRDAVDYVHGRLSGDH